MSQLIIHIRDISDLVEAIRSVQATAKPFSLQSAGTKKNLGRYVTQDQILSLKALTGVTLYEPEELVLSARAATPLAEIETLLAKNNQQLAFEPIDYAFLLGQSANKGTIAGALAINASGPRRVKAGAARDHLLGFSAVTGRGEFIRSGGRVMKNVTGFDLSKLLCGSYGTLAALTDITLKVMPKAETEKTLIFFKRTEAECLKLLRQATASSHDVSGICMVPAGRMEGFGQNIAAMRLEGPEISVSSRCESLCLELVENDVERTLLNEETSRLFWQKIKNVEPITTCNGQVWRLSIAPRDGNDVIKSLQGAGLPIQGYFYDWAGGLIWLAVDPAPHAYAKIIRMIVDQKGGHATLIRADAETRATIDVFHPQPEVLAQLTSRIKCSFDPACVLERGRLRAEF